MSRAGERRSRVSLKSDYSFAPRDGSETNLFLSKEEDPEGS